MGDAKPVTTDKVVLPKNLQREMMKFFIQASIAKNVKENTERDKQQTPLNTETEES
jgi:hypothetical protein